MANRSSANELVLDVLMDVANGLTSHPWEEAQASDIALQIGRADENV